MAFLVEKHAVESGCLAFPYQSQQRRLIHTPQNWVYNHDSLARN